MSEKPSFEIMVRRLNKPVWKERIPPTDSEDMIATWISEVMKIHSEELHGSFQVVMKLNGGYGKNPDNGATWMVNQKGKLRFDELWNRINFIHKKVALRKPEGGG